MARTTMDIKTKSTSEGTRERLHELVDRLPDEELHAARRFLEFIQARGDPVLKALLEAPLDDEPTTEEEERLVQEARDEVERGETISHEEMRREFGW